MIFAGRMVVRIVALSFDIFGMVFARAGQVLRLRFATSA